MKNVVAVLLHMPDIPFVDQLTASTK